ncbi:MAG: hypothetical protein NW226_18075 [Microscillaceae bacterium]|nr:hypothetical protein [Microscillaceae bacterium]
MADINDLKKLGLKLKIIPMVEKGEPEPIAYPSGEPFIALINPETIALKQEISYSEENAKGKEGTDPVFGKIMPKSFSLDFVLDGTGGNGLKIPVNEQVERFKRATFEVRGDIHRPPYLVVQYGTFIIDCVMKDFSITYTLFDSSGVPLRAKVSASFTERIKPTQSDKKTKASSPDMTHIREAKEGELLPLMLFREYGTQDYYLQVGRVNRLKTIRKLKQGMQIILPPIK